MNYLTLETVTEKSPNVYTIVLKNQDGSCIFGEGRIKTIENGMKLLNFSPDTFQKHLTMGEFDSRYLRDIIFKFREVNKIHNDLQRNLCRNNQA